MIDPSWTREVPAFPTGTFGYYYAVKRGRVVGIFADW